MTRSDEDEIPAAIEVTWKLNAKHLTVKFLLIRPCDTDKLVRTIVKNTGGPSGGLFHGQSVHGKLPCKQNSCFLKDVSDKYVNNLFVYLKTKTLVMKST
jgi:hypothetical protein